MYQSAKSLIRSIMVSERQSCLSLGIVQMYCSPSSSIALRAPWQAISSSLVLITRSLYYGTIYLPTDQLVMGSAVVSFCNSLDPALGTSMGQIIFATTFARRVRLAGDRRSSNRPSRCCRLKGRLDARRLACSSRSV